MVKFTNLGHVLSPNVPPRTVGLIDLLEPSSPRTLTYDDIHRHSRAVARGLLRRGLREGDAIAIISANRAEFLLVLFGAMRAGLVAVPVNFKLPPSQVEFVLRDCGARLVFCDAAQRSACPADIATVTFGAAGADGFDAFLDHGDFESITPRPKQVAMIAYTSGSSGRPKGVLFSHQGHIWANDVRSRGEPLRNDRALVAAPLYHMNGLAWSQTLLANGGTVVLMPRFNAADYVKAIAEYRATIVPSIPTMVAMMLEQREVLAATDLSSVRLVRMSSAPLSQAILDQARAAFPKALVANGYGTTEGGPYIFGAHPQKLPLPPLSVGYPDPDVLVRLIREGREVEDEGELEVRTPATMLGYHNLPDVARNAVTEDGFYRTGDIFSCDANGFYFFVRRVDDMFVCGGENVFPNEVEQIVAAHPAVHQVCVVPMPDGVKGHKPVAFVVAKPDASVSEQHIKEYVLARAPAYQHPRRVWFVEELPLAGTNKVDRRKLTELAAGSA
jgi:acyl-CoA synthetase (AMP-forming)/AMP-acid ligase II